MFLGAIFSWGPEFFWGKEIFWKMPQWDRGFFWTEAFGQRQATRGPRERASVFWRPFFLGVNDRESPLRKIRPGRCNAKSVFFFLEMFFLGEMLVLSGEMFLRERDTSVFWRRVRCVRQRTTSDVRCKRHRMSFWEMPKSCLFPKERERRKCVCWRQSLQTGDSHEEMP
jgi:hypothetical protein